MEPSFMDELLIQVHNMISRSKTAQSEERSLKKLLNARFKLLVVRSKKYAYSIS